MQFDSTVYSEINDENKEILKYFGGEIALYAELIEFHTFGILLSVILFGKKDSGRLFWSYLLFIPLKTSLWEMKGKITNITKTRKNVTYQHTNLNFWNNSK